MAMDRRMTEGRFECEECEWTWPLLTAPPNGAECDNCEGELVEIRYCSQCEHEYSADVSHACTCADCGKPLGANHVGACR